PVNTQPARRPAESPGPVQDLPICRPPPDSLSSMIDGAGSGELCERDRRQAWRADSPVRDRRAVSALAGDLLPPPPASAHHTRREVPLPPSTSHTERRSRRVPNPLYDPTRERDACGIGLVADA